MRKKILIPILISLSVIGLVFAQVHQNKVKKINTEQINNEKSEELIQVIDNKIDDKFDEFYFSGEDFIAGGPTRLRLGQQATWTTDLIPSLDSNVDLGSEENKVDYGWLDYLRVGNSTTTNATTTGTHYIGGTASTTELFVQGDSHIGGNTTLDGTLNVAGNIRPTADGTYDLGDNTYYGFNYIYGRYFKRRGTGMVLYMNNASECMEFSGSGFQFGADVYPNTDSSKDLGTSSKYWAETYTDKLYLNSTATLGGVTAGLVDLTGNLTVSGNATTTGSLSAGQLAVGSAFYFPTTDGNANEILKTDGSGNLTWQSDNAGAGGTGSNWDWAADQSFIKPSTTVGILINASSTIASNFRVDGNATTTGSSHITGDFDVNGTANFDGAVTGIALNEIENLTDNKTFALDDKTLTWQFTNPSGGIYANITGAFTGDAFHWHQVTGNPGYTHLGHFHAEDTDVIPLHIGGVASTTFQMFYGTGEAEMIDESVAFRVDSAGDFEIDTKIDNATTTFQSNVKVVGNATTTGSLSAGQLLVDNTPLNIANWDTAYGWGDHSSAGYLNDINSSQFGQLTDMSTTTLVYGSIPIWDTSNWTSSSTWSLFETQWISYTNASSTIATAADITTDIATHLAVIADTNTTGHLNDTDWDTFNSKWDGLTDMVLTDNYIYVGDASNDPVGVAMSNDCTIASDGVITCDHDALDNFVADEHLNWTNDLGAVNIHAGNYTDTNTTYLGGTNLTLVDTTFNVDDKFLKNDADDTTSYGITMGSATTTDSFAVGGKASSTSYSVNGLFTVDNLGNSTSTHSAASEFLLNGTPLLDWTSSVGTIHTDNYIEGHGNGANCNAGEYALGVDASGAVENCTDATTEINTIVNGLGGTGLTCAAQSCDVDLGTAITTGEITDDEILEVDLDVTNSPTDNYILSFDSGTAGFTWVEDATGAGGGAFAWTDTTWGMATSTILGFETGFLSNASSTIIGDFRVDGALGITGVSTFGTSVYLDDNNGSSPVFYLRDADEATLSMYKDDAGQASISNSEGAIRIKPSGDADDYFVFSSDGAVLTFTTQAGNDGDLVITAGGGDISFGDDNLITTGNATTTGHFSAAEYLVGTAPINLDNIAEGASYERVAAAELSSGIYKDATVSVKGIASFSDTYFSVASGVVSIDDIYLKDGESDTMTGTLTCDGLTLGANELLTIGGQTLTHDTTDFVFNDSVSITGNATSSAHIAATEFLQNGTSLVSLYEGILTNSAGLLNALDDETGTGLAVFSTLPTFTTGIDVTGYASSTSINVNEFSVNSAGNATSTRETIWDGTNGVHIIPGPTTTMQFF